MQTVDFIYKNGALERLLVIGDLDATSGRCITGAEIYITSGGSDANADDST
jgi:hypothetical protein